MRMRIMINDNECSMSDKCLINVDFLSNVIVECLRPASPRLYFCDRVEFLPESDSLESKRGFLSTTHFSTLLNTSQTNFVIP